MEKEQLIILIVFFSGLSLLVALFLVAVFLIQRNKTNKFLLEKELRQQQYETQLLQTQIEVQEETRKNIGIELHDNIGQLLSLTNLTLGTIKLNEKEQTEEKLINARSLIKRSIGELRQLSKVLQAEFLLQEDLEEAIRKEIIWLQRNGYFTINFINKNEHHNKRNKEKDLFVFRLVQECLNNIIKHAEAKNIDIILDYQMDCLQMEISDNGKGFELAKIEHPNSGIGLNNMKKRIKLLNGNMNIESGVGRGTSINFSIPYP